MTDTTTEVRARARPYEPSWIDRFTDWVEQLPVPEWVFYGGLGLVLIAIQLLFLWWDGGLHLGTLLPVIVFNALAIPYSLALIHALDNQAVRALNAMRPTLAIAEPDLHELQYRLSTMPSRPTIMVGLGLMIFLLLTEGLGVVPVRYAALDDLPVFSIVYHLIDKSIAFLVGPFVYHTIAQLRLVNTIYSEHARINLFDIKPLYAFSTLTASTAAGLVVTAYGWMLINPELLTEPVGLVGTTPFALLAVAVFVWPLLGAHRLMDAEKDSMLHRIDQQFAAAFAAFNQRFQDGDYAAMEGLNATIASLEIQHNKVKAIPTWPWRPETVRSVLAVIALPPVLSAIQQLVERLFRR
jgi:hypothetical protein